jgi:spore coat polysaccharide biosynthesis predicted glycosyltransferase SpsG
MLQRLGASWLVLDGYEFDGSYQDLVDGSARTLVIDDHGHAGRYQAQVILDQNAGAEPGAYAMRPADSLLLLGPRFALIAPEFTTVARRDRQGPVRCVVFMLGGAPSEHVTGMTAAAGSALVSFGLEVHAVGGTPSGTGFDWRSSTPTVPETLRDADLCVAAAGITTWECCCAGLPTLLFATAPNQEAVAAEAAKAGAAIDLGRAEDIDFHRIVAVVRELADDVDALRTMANAGQSLVDGSGSDRVVDQMWPRLHLREARQEDDRLLWTWANDPTVRQASFSEDAIGWDEHVRWLDDRLSDPDTRLFVATSDDDAPVGQIRFDRTGSEAVISVSLEATTRGLGLSSAAIRLGVSAILDMWPEVSTVIALVKVDNAPSIRTFRSAGFHPRDDVLVRKSMARRYELQREEFSVRR